MTEKFCPDYCGFKTEKPVKGACDVCHHKDDVEVEPFMAVAFGKLMSFFGKNNDHYYAEDGSSIHESQITHVVFENKK